MSLVYLGLGSNIEPVANLEAGLAELSSFGHLVSESDWYQSSAVGFDGPDFINLVVALDTDLALDALNDQLKQLERQFGRAADARKYSSRCLDVDILLFDDLAGQFGDMKLPRSDIYRFAFVLKPLLEIAPDLCCPSSGERLDQYWNKLAEQSLTLVSAKSPGLENQQAV